MVGRPRLGRRIGNATTVRTEIACGVAVGCLTPMTWSLRRVRRSSGGPGAVPAAAPPPASAAGHSLTPMVGDACHHPLRAPDTIHKVPDTRPIPSRGSAGFFSTGLRDLQDSTGCISCQNTVRKTCGGIIAEAVRIGTAATAWPPRRKCNCGADRIVRTAVQCYGISTLTLKKR